jgi:hypothetical protein
MLSAVKLSLPIYMYCYAECHYTECHYAECHYAECSGAVEFHHGQTLLKQICPEVVFLFMCDHSTNEL